MQSYDPFGKPGAGAPFRDSSGKPIGNLRELKNSPESARRNISDRRISFGETPYQPNFGSSRDANKRDGTRSPSPLAQQFGSPSDRQKGNSISIWISCSDLFTVLPPLLLPSFIFQFILFLPTFLCFSVCSFFFWRFFSSWIQQLWSPSAKSAIDRASKTTRIARCFASTNRGKET